MDIYHEIYSKTVPFHSILVTDMLDSGIISGSSKENSVEPSSANSIACSTYSLIVQPKLLHLSLSSSCLAFGILDDTIFDNRIS
jgi:hypothetical protein